MTYLYTQNNSAQAQNQLFNSVNVNDVVKCFLNKGKHNKNNFIISIARMHSDAYLGIARKKKGPHEEPFNIIRFHAKL